MFFDLVSRNSKRNRKENSLFFSSLLISIIAFYLILSLSHQDVMLFLAKMESNAVDKLLSMIPLFYGATLFVLFFLIFFACKYQLESRKHELGMYLMLGMRRYKLFFMLLAEDVKNNIMALLIGLPIAMIISEFISLITARMVGLGIIGHKLSISLEAVLLTTLGFILIKLVAFLILSGKIARQDIGDLLVEKPEGDKKQLSRTIYFGMLVVGIVLLVIAYVLAISGYAWSDFSIMAVALMCGFAGTFFVFFGMRFLLDKIAKNSKKGKSLHTFTFRQLQEGVIHKSNSMAISSLLVLAAMCCFGSGIAIAKHYNTSEKHTLDYTFEEDRSIEYIKSKLGKEKMKQFFSTVFEMKTGYIMVDSDMKDAFQMQSVMSRILEQPDSSEKENLLNNLAYADYPHLISVSGYNQLLALSNEPEISLKDNEIAVYMDSEFATEGMRKILNEILKTRPEASMAGETFFMTGEVQDTNLVVDSSITLSFALIVSDKVFEQMTTGTYSTYVNAVLNEKQTIGKSLLNAVMDVNEQLDRTGIYYQSYLQNIGRQLFYVVAASYITIYLAIVFLIIANTVIGVQFLTQLQRTKGRYQTLIRIGATYEALGQSIKKQIYWYFGIPIVVAVTSSLFGIRSLLTGILSSFSLNDMISLMLISLAMILLLCVVECIYISIVIKSGKRYLLSLMTLKREE